MHQEDIENKVCHLAIQTTKLTMRELIKALESYTRHLQNSRQMQSKEPKGKQTVKQLIGQGQGVSSIPVAETGLKDFQRMARKYGVDFAVVKDKSELPVRYTVFFKARDSDAITQVLKEYSEKQMKNKGRKSVREILDKLKEKVALTPKKEKKKEIIR